MMSLDAKLTIAVVVILIMGFCVDPVVDYILR